MRFVDRHVPVGVRGGERLVRHPRGESLVQPDVVPPRHRDEIAEPLMRHLVREHRFDRLAHRHRRRLLVGQQVGFAVEDRRGVLHGAGREVGHGDDVELLEGVLDGVVAVVEMENPLRRVESEPRQILLLGRRADPDRDAVGAAL